MKLVEKTEGLGTQADNNVDTKLKNMWVWTKKFEKKKH